MSNVEIYVQLAWLLLTFWNIYLRLANCWMSYFGASFFLVCLYYFSIPRPQASLIEVEPISPYTVFIQTQSPAVLFSPSPSLYLNFCSTHKHLQTHTNFTIHTADMLIHRGTPFHAGRQTTSQRSDKLMPFSLCTCRGDALFQQRPPIPVHCMSQPPVMYVLMNVFPFNSGMKMLLKEMPSLIPNMPVAVPSLGYLLSHSFTFIYSYLMLSFLSLFAKV